MKRELSAILKYSRTFFLSFIFIFFIPTLTEAQDDDIKSEILNHKDTVKEYISNGRWLLTEKFVAGDLAKVKQIKDYLSANVANDDYLVFYPSEYYLILYWTQEYKELLRQINSQDSTYRSIRKKIKPQYDLLLVKLSSKTSYSKNQLSSNIIAADLSEVEKDFLLLHLEYTIALSEGITMKRDSLNKMADGFLSKHPKSKYDEYVRKNIRYQFAPSPWGIGLEFFSGYGFFTGSLSENFSSSIPFGVAFDIQYKKWILYLRDFFSRGRTRNDIPFSNGIWKMHSQVVVFLPEASVGYVVAENKLLKVAPFMGIATIDIGPSSNDLQAQPALKNADFGLSRTYTFGFNTDFKLGRPKRPNSAFQSVNDYRLIKVRYAYNMPQFEEKYPGVNGNFHYITIGIGIFSRKTSRIK